MVWKAPASHSRYVCWELWLGAPLKPSLQPQNFSQCLRVASCMCVYNCVLQLCRVNRQSSSPVLSWKTLTWAVYRDLLQMNVKSTSCIRGVDVKACMKSKTQAGVCFANVLRSIICREEPVGKTLSWVSQGNNHKLSVRKSKIHVRRLRY